MANILITGSNGQLGSELRDIWGDAAPKINFFRITHNFFFTDVLELDITDREAVESYIYNNKIDIIINCAAYTSVDNAEEDIERATIINVDAVKNLADTAFRHSIKLLIHISTDYVFDGKGYRPYREDDACNPVGVYCKTKYGGEKEIQKSGCNYFIIRASWLYSIYGVNFVKTIAKLSHKRSSLNVVFDQVGTPTYAGDLANTIEVMVRKFISTKPEEQNMLCGIYHFSNEGVCSWYDFAKEIVSQTNSNCHVFPITTEQYSSKTPRPFYSVLDKSKIKAVFGIVIPHWRETITSNIFWEKVNI